MVDKVNMILAATGATVGYFLGGYDVLLKVFATILVIDTCTGMYKAYMIGSYKSSLFRKGIFKKSGYLIALLLVVQLDMLMGNIGALRSAILFCFIANESTSIIENLGEIGVPIPAAIKNAIAVLKDKGEEV